jgi:Tol biopolymer transport system component
VYRRGMQNGERDLYALRLGTDTSGTPLIDTRFDEAAPVLSPDGRWIAYAAADDGRYSIFVRPFPGADAQWRVSRDGGTGPVWAKGGSELLYVNAADSMVAVTVTDSAGTAVFGPETPLFDARDYRTDFFHRPYDVTQDGQRFVMIRVDEDGVVPNDIIVVDNWFEELRQRVGR